MISDCCKCYICYKCFSKAILIIKLFKHIPTIIDCQELQFIVLM